MYAAEGRAAFEHAEVTRDRSRAPRRAPTHLPFPQGHTVPATLKADPDFQATLGAFLARFRPGDSRR